MRSLFCLHDFKMHWRALGGTLTLVFGETLSAPAQIKPQELADAASNWVIVQPMHTAGFRFDSANAIADALKREWGVSVPIDAATRGQNVEAMRWSLSVAPQQASILLLPEEALLIGEKVKEHPAHISNYEPLVVLGFKRWCAFTNKQSTLQSADQLLEWVKVQSQELRIALPIAAGRMRVWTQGMAHLTQRTWQIQVYGVNGDFTAALADGADVAIARCDRVGARSDNARVLLQSGEQRSTFQADVPTFQEAGWMPFDHGWEAMFTPKSVPVPERERMAQVLYAVVHSPEMKENLVQSGFIAADLSPAASHEYLLGFAKAWKLVGRFLLGRSFDDLSEMKEPAVPHSN